MLTATYSLVAIAAEQDKARSLLQRLQHFIEASWKGLQDIDLGFMEAAHQKLLRFDHFLRERKIEQFLIPLLRQAGQEAELLIAELDSLRARSARALQSAGRELSSRIELNGHEIARLSDAMHTYCAHVAARLRLEEQALLPLARRLLSVEDWFHLAAEFLSSAESPDQTGTKRQPSPSGHAVPSNQYH